MTQSKYNLADKALYTIAVLGLIAASCTPAPATAQAVDAESKYSLVLHGLSEHTGDQVFNEKNAGLGIRYTASKDLSYQLGIYNNSYNKTTVYATAQYTPLQVSNIKIGGFVGFASGYSHITKVPVVAGAMLDVALTSKNHITFRAIPKVGNSAGVVTVELTTSFNQ